MRRLLIIAGVAALAIPGLAAAQPSPSTADAGDYGADSAYSGAPMGVATREDHFEREIQRSVDSGTISDYDAQQDRRILASIRDREQALDIDHGGLTPDDQASLNDNLNTLRARMNQQMGDSY